MIYEYFGGNTTRIKKLLEEYLERTVKYAKSKIIEIMKRDMDSKRRKIFKDVIKVIINNVFYESSKD